MFITSLVSSSVTGIPKAEKRAAIVRLYEDTALRMYQGLARRMADYGKSPATREKCLAELFQTAQ